MCTRITFLSLLSAAEVQINLEFPSYNTNEGVDFSVEVCAVVTGGTIDPGVTLVAALSTTPVTASTGE